MPQTERYWYTDERRLASFRKRVSFPVCVVGTSFLHMSLFRSVRRSQFRFLGNGYITTTNWSTRENLPNPIFYLSSFPNSSFGRRKVYETRLQNINKIFSQFLRLVFSFSNKKTKNSPRTKKIEHSWEEDGAKILSRTSVDSRAGKKDNRSNKKEETNSLTGRGLTRLLILELFYSKMLWHRHHRVSPLLVESCNKIFFSRLQCKLSTSVHLRRKPLLDEEEHLKREDVRGSPVSVVEKEVTLLILPFSSSWRLSYPSSQRNYMAIPIDWQ